MNTRTHSIMLRAILAPLSEAERTIALMDALFENISHGKASERTEIGIEMAYLHLRALQAWRMGNMADAERFVNRMNEIQHE